MSAYSERAAPAPISGSIACLWSTVATGRGPILPDGCVDLIHMEGVGAFVAGPDTGPGASATGLISGLRMRTGHAAAVLGVPVHELCDQRVALEEVWGRAGAELGARLDEAPSAAARQALLAGAVAPRATPADPLALGAVALLAERPERRVADVARELFVSERHLLRRLRVSVGYGPKTLARVMRFQRLLALAQTHAASLADLALEAGYADQPHMTAEVSRLAGAPPTEILGVAYARGDAQLVRSFQDAGGLAA